MTELTNNNAVEREWLPTEWIDEIYPPTKPSPDDFVIGSSGCWYIGYAADDKDASEDDRDSFHLPVVVGDIVRFSHVDDYGWVEVTFRNSGGYEAHGELPPDDVGCWIPFDEMTACDSFAEFAQRVEKAGDDVRSAVFKPGDGDVRVTLRFSKWVHDVPHRLVLIDGKPHFEQVPAAAANN